MAPNINRHNEGLKAWQKGLSAEQAAIKYFTKTGWVILQHRARNQAGEIDLILQKQNLIVFAEVKHRRKLTDAAYAIRPSQQRKIIQAAEIMLANKPEWTFCDLRFDAVLTDNSNRLIHIPDCFRVI